MTNSTRFRDELVHSHQKRKPTKRRERKKCVAHDKRRRVLAIGLPIQLQGLWNSKIFVCIQFVSVLAIWIGTKKQIQNKIQYKTRSLSKRPYSTRYWIQSLKNSAKKKNVLNLISMVTSCFWCMCECKVKRENSHRQANSHRRYVLNGLLFLLCHLSMCWNSARFSFLLYIHFSKYNGTDTGQIVFIYIDIDTGSCIRSDSGESSVRLFGCSVVWPLCAIANWDPMHVYTHRECVVVRFRSQ